MGATKIGWTDESWNPVTGCTEVSPGCAHCYAKTLAERFRGVKGHPYENGFDLTLRPERLKQPLGWRKPRMVFVNSMSDLFHEDIPDDYVDKVFAVMWLAGTPDGAGHVFQVLTKRPQRMRDYLTDRHRESAIADAAMAMVKDDVLPSRFARLCYRRANAWQPFARLPLPNVWLGTSIENRRFVDRADLLRQTPAAIRFISAEPLLGPLRFDGHRDQVLCWRDDYAGPQLDLTGIDWLIVGGESGFGCRPMDLDWVSALRRECVDRAWGDHRPAFFLKQLGGHPDKRADDKAVLDGRTWTEFPEPAGLPDGGAVA